MAKLPAPWPDDYPSPPGGTLLRVPDPGKITVSAQGYLGLTLEQLDEAHRAALAAAGWSAEPTGDSPEARRYKTSKAGRSVSVSIRAQGKQAILQVMEF